MTIGALTNLGAKYGHPELGQLGHSLDVYSVLYDNTIGISHQFWEDRLSVAAAVRILYGSRNIKIKLDDAPPAAFAPVLGTDKTLADTEASGFGTESIIDYEYKKADGVGAALLGAKEDEHFSYVLPAFLSVGVGWQVIPQLYLAAGMEYYFNDLADYAFDDAWSIVFGAEYRFNKMLAVSLGGFYTDIGSKKKEGGNDFTNPYLDSFTYCGGFELTFFDDLVVDIGGFYVQYFSEHYQGVKLSKKIFEGAISVTYRFF